MSDSTHTVTVRAFDSAYPGSMFDKPHGEYVERGDASSLAAALLELVAKHKRDAEDFEDALKQEKAERNALRAEVALIKSHQDELLEVLAEMVVRFQNLRESNGLDRKSNLAKRAYELIAKAAEIAALKGGA